MNVLDDIVELVSPNVVVTAGAILLAPLVLPVITRGLRPMAKGTSQGVLDGSGQSKRVYSCNI